VRAVIPRPLRSGENVSEASSRVSETGEPGVPSRYRIAIGILLVSLVLVSLAYFQQTNSLQLQNNQLSSHSSSLSDNLSDLNKIVSLGKSQVLADDQTIFWTAGMTAVRLDWSCQCFQYSGYLHINWTSTTNLHLRVVQFGLNLTTPSIAVADFKIPISSGEPFAASFVMANCSTHGGCTATYSAVYHY
jgi:uncharacterized membrane protein (Fun14 family)